MKGKRKEERKRKRGRKKKSRKKGKIARHGAAREYKFKILAREIHISERLL